MPNEQEYVSQFVGENMDLAFKRALYPDSTAKKNSPNLLNSGAVYNLATKISNITLASTWTGEGPYSQAVTILGANITPMTKVDLQPTMSQIFSLKEDGVEALLIENNGGVLTAKALGSTPASAMTIQCTMTEVIQ